MEQALGRIASVLVAAVTFCVIPLIIHMQRQESMIQLSIMTYTVQFTDAVRNSGRMTKSMYQRYENQIRGLQQGLEISMVHTKKSLHMGESGVENTEKIYTESDMMTCLEETSEYLFQKGDFFRVEIRKTQQDLLDSVLQAVVPEQADTNDIYVYYGGTIRYEDGALVYNSQCRNDSVWCFLGNEDAVAESDVLYPFLL